MDDPKPYPLHIIEVPAEKILEDIAASHVDTLHRLRTQLAIRNSIEKMPWSEAQKDVMTGADHRTSASLLAACGGAHGLQFASASTRYTG